MTENDPKAPSNNERPADAGDDTEVEATDWPSREKTVATEPVAHEPEPEGTAWPDSKGEQVNREVAWPAELDQDTWEDSAVDS